MNEFSEYEKMPKNFNSLGQDTTAFSELNKLKWAVTEKVHGANFSFVYRDRKLAFAKRKEYLSWSDDFFGFQEVVHQLEDKVLALFEQLSADLPAEKYMLYGELFGGSYPHPEVLPYPNVQAIQTGVYYTPAIGFCAFDIAIVKDGTKAYLDYEDAVGYLERFGIFHARVLFTGKLNEALNFNTRINSAVPAQLGWPALENNLIEGVVIKPLRHNGLIENDERPILKLKNKEFDEEKKFHEAEKWSYIPGVTTNTEQIGFLLEEIRTYLTDNRLNSVISKIGSLDFTNADRLAAIHAEYLRDMLEDFNIDNKGVLDEITPSQKEWLINRLNAEITISIGQRRKFM
ncbi:2'-5' RNA ligase [Flavobacterium album]|uniref:2'-5' RNA ligase n=1 Tax=Flavobacterium album TaxID=2175091 RepID=A0A2S1QTU7_9FLAO|nr:RNA ligase family protein [Flavobacterium album]AWH83842.1 2'-5' RNA ligase [Flavobacterium album]